MNPAERENIIYSKGKKNELSKEEFLMFELLKDKQGSLLDVGCGEGTISNILIEKGFDVVGIDFSNVAVEKAKGQGVKAMVVDVDNGIPFDENKFDVVWMGDILEHVFDPIFLLAEAKRVLKENGCILLTVPNEMWWKARINAIFGKSPQSSVYRTCKQCKHHTVMSLELLLYFIKEAHLSIVDFKGVCKYPFINKVFVSKKFGVSSLFGKSFVLKISK